MSSPQGGSNVASRSFPSGRHPFMWAGGGCLGFREVGVLGFRFCGLGFGFRTDSGVDCWL